MLKVAIVGCGKIADEHAHEVKRAEGSVLVAFCDSETLMARQMHERFEGTVYFNDLNTLLRDVRPDVVHITTPPQSHYPVAMRCLEAGCHLFIEKPFMMTTHEAEEVLDRATRRNLNVTVDHNYQFTTPALRMRALVKAGFLGGPPTHLESYYYYDLSDESYASAFLSDTGHWVRSLPGGLLQNIISHGIARIAEHLSSDSPTVTAHAFTSELLERLGERTIRDELRVLIKDGSTTAYFTFSSQMRPQVFQLRLFGRRNGLFLDDNHHVLIKLKGKKYKSYLEHFIPPVALASELVRSAVANVAGFVSHRLNMNEGMRELIRRFYSSIALGAPLPIPYVEILRTCRIMDAIFLQINSAHDRHSLPLEAIP
jgi:predicted dehydrogenase